MKRTFYLLISLIGLALIGVTNRGHAQSAIHGTTQIHAGGHMGVYNSLSFVSGAVVTPRNEPTANILWTAGATHSGASNSSHVNGYAEKAGTDAFMFPVGDGTKLRMAGISAPASAGNYRAAYFAASPASATLPTGGPFPTANLGTGVTAVSTTEYWDVDGSGAVNLTLTWDAGSSVSALAGGDMNKLVIVGYNTSTSKWESLGQAGGVTGTMSTTGTVTANAVTPSNYAAFTFGNAVPNTPNLVTTKVASGTLVQGSNFNYVFTVKNTGVQPSTGTITVTDTLRNGLTYVSGTGTGWTISQAGTDGSGNPIVQATSTTAIAVSATSSYTLTVKPTVAGPISNLAWTGGGGMPGGPYKSGPTEGQAGSLSSPSSGTATESNVSPGTPCSPIEPGIATASAASVQTGGSASFTLSGNGTGTTTWAIFPNNGVSPNTGTGNFTSNITFTQAGQYQVIFTTTSATSATCNQPSTAVATAEFMVTSPNPLCPYPGASSVAVSPTSAAIGVGANASFTLSGGTPSSSVQWFVNPTTGVTPTAGSGTTTSSVLFNNAGLYNVVFVMVNTGDGNCVPVQKTSSALIAVGLNACAPPTPIIITSTASNNTSAVGQSVTFAATGGTPNQGTLSWVVTNASGGTVTSGTGTPAMVTFAQGGLYTITYRATNSSTPTGCTSPVTISKSITHLVTGTAPGVVVAAKVFLAGPLSGAQMTTNLRNGNLIPTTDPYGKGATASATVVGSSSPSGSNGIVDWVLIELRSSASTIVESHAALLQADGDIVSTDGTSPVSFSATSGNFFVSIRHRNHLGVMTAAALPLTSAATTVDFTQPSTATYGTNAQRTVGSVRALWAGNAVSTPAAELVRYSGPSNDPNGISSLVTTGGGAITTTVSNVYSIADVDLNGSVRYSGPSNDVSIVSGSVTNHPANTTKVITYSIPQTFN